MSPIVLVVDDVDVNLQIARLMLERLGYRAVLAGSGADALRRLEEHRYDAVLMDCNMPLMDGYETTRAIRRRLVDVPLPIIALTAGDAYEHVEERLDAGIDDILPKPLILKDLAVMLQRWITAEPADSAQLAAPPSNS